MTWISGSYLKPWNLNTMPPTDPKITFKDVWNGTHKKNQLDEWLIHTLTQCTSLQQRNITCEICQETCTGLPNLTFYTSALATGYCGHINTVQHKVFTCNNYSKNEQHIYFPSCTWMLKILHPLTYWKSLMSLKTQYSWINIPKYTLICAFHSFCN
jgi:hypothetical protein